MQFPDDRLYSQDHLWLKWDGDQDVAVIGITEYAKEELGDVDYVELPEPDDMLDRNEPFGIIETSKAVTDLIAPISATVTESNTELLETPAAITEDPYGSGWLVKVVPSERTELDGLIKPKDYQNLVQSLMQE